MKPFYAAKIPESRVEEAFGWLRSNGHEDLIKNTVTASFNRGQDNQVAELIKVCEEYNFTYNQKQKVEPMTLKAFVKERVEKGLPIDLDLFGAFVARTADVKRRKT